jgi:hypothetical protein
VATRGARERAALELRRLAAPLLVAALLTALLTRSAWGPGQLLYRDFVSVPDPVVGAAALGTDGQPPRAVPLDAVTALLSAAVPTWLQQQLMLAATVFLAALGVAVLLRSRGTAATVSAAAFAAWNPYVAERLLLGQPPTLLGYAMIPWLVVAVRSRLRPATRVLAVAVAAAPAALTPWGAVLAAGVVLGTAVFLCPRPQGRLPWAYAALAALWCLPWAVPALAHGSGTGDRDGAAAFAVGADSWAGTGGSVLTLGGIWAPAARLDSRQSALAVLCSLAVLALAAWGGVELHREGRRRAAAALGAAWAGPTVFVLVVSDGPGLVLFGLLQGVPGVALLRDTHRLLALPAIATAVLFGVAVGLVSRRVAQRAESLRGRTARGAGAGPASAAVLGLVTAAVSLSVLTAPELPRRLDSAYRPVSFPAEWEEAVAAARETAGESSVLVLPWQPLRRVAWAGPHPFLDPLPRALRPTVLTSSTLTVPRDGELLRVGTDPAEARAWRAGVLDTAALRRLGVRCVIEWKGTPGVLPRAHAGLSLVHSGEHFVVWAVPAGDAASRVSRNSDGGATSG